MHSNEDQLLAVKRGATWLDTVIPDWFQRIDVNKLELTGECDCILGQTFGDFWEAPYPGSTEPLYDRVQWAREHGFWVLEANGSWGRLRRLWIEALEARLDGSKEG